MGGRECSSRFPSSHLPFLSQRHGCSRTVNSPFPLSGLPWSQFPPWVHLPDWHTETHSQSHTWAGSPERRRRGIQKAGGSRRVQGTFCTRSSLSHHLHARLEPIPSNSTRSLHDASCRMASCFLSCRTKETPAKTLVIGWGIASSNNKCCLNNSGCLSD